MQPATTATALIETARGLLAFGALDYLVALDIPADSVALAYAAAHIVIASRAAGLASPVASITPALDAAPGAGGA